MFRFPWGDMHSLNLGWFLQKFNELREDWATAEAGIDGALDAEIEKAENALSDVFDARDAAAASATAAAGSATAAGTSATAAQNSATGAASSATLANQKATAAGLSEAAAAQSATQAGNSATAAAGSATAAGAAATNAADSATAAQNSATAAAASETGAAENATAAAASEVAAAASASAAAASAAATVRNKSLHDLILGVLFKNDFSSSTTGYIYDLTGNHFEMTFSNSASTAFSTFAISNVPRAKIGVFNSSDIIDDDLIDISKIPYFENTNIDLIMVAHAEALGENGFNIVIGTADENDNKYIDSTITITNTLYKNITSFMRDYKKLGLYFQIRKKVPQTETVKITVDIIPIPHDIATALALSN